MASNLAADFVSMPPTTLALGACISCFARAFSTTISIAAHGLRRASQLPNDWSVSAHMKTRKFCQQRLPHLLLTFLIAIALIGCSAGDNVMAASINSAAKTGGTLGQRANGRTASQVEGIHLIDARIHAPAPGQPMSAGYFILMNHGIEAVTLTGLISDTVAVQMHTTKVENNGTTMRPLNSITIAADDQIVFKPGGDHLMVRGLPRDIKSIPLTMQFEHGASLETTFTVLFIDEWMEKQTKPGLDHVDH